MIDARAFRACNAIQNLGSPGKVEHGTQSSILLSERQGNYIVHLGGTVFKFYLCNGHTSIVSFAAEIYRCASSFSHTGRARDTTDFDSGLTVLHRSCHGRMVEAQRPKLLGVGMILYWRYLGITVETSSSADDSLPGPSRAQVIGGPARMGPSSPLPPLHLCHH